MHIHKITIKNFRLLSDIELELEKNTTLIVGRNNSGKTSLSEIIRRLLEGSSPSFQLEDFSSACYDDFCTAVKAHQNEEGDEVVRSMVPFIELRLEFKYDPTQSEFGTLSPFIIDLDPDCDTAAILIRHELKGGSIADFFGDLPSHPLSKQTKTETLRAIRERLADNFETHIWAEDPNDPSNQREVAVGSLRSLLKTGFINAQRGLDDITSKSSDVLAKVLEGLFTKANADQADAEDKAIADALTEAVQGIQSEIDSNFSSQLKKLLPTLQSFGYPGLGGQELQTETTLDVDRLLSNFTKVSYAGYGGIPLPETYNGLGVRNLIFILLQMVGFYKAYRAESTAPGFHLIFIEEPEAHLHPQMQEVFIRQLSELANRLSESSDGPDSWPVQFIVSTHSSHIANEAGFETIRYFLSKNRNPSTPDIRHTEVKDLSVGLAKTPAEDKKFLHQYLTLTRCDLFFADKAILVEGLSERLMLPQVISKLESKEPNLPKLSEQYTTTLEVGGAYAHIFIGLLEFLELSSLIITDLDSVTKPGGTACIVSKGKATSNTCIKHWFPKSSFSAIQKKSAQQKQKNKIRIAYQCPEKGKKPCGRTFEDAFILANTKKFNITAKKVDDQEVAAKKTASKFKKSAFALRYAIAETDWVSPRYLTEGIRWLARQEKPVKPILAAPKKPQRRTRRKSLTSGNMKGAK